MKIALHSSKPFMEIGTTSEVFAKKIFYSFLDLTTAIDNLKHVSTFFSIKSLPKYYEKNDISEIQYYKYHLENHYIRITSILDLTVNFINNIFRLGLPQKKCNVFSVLENLNIKGSPTEKALKSFENKLQHIKQKRNIIIHQGKLESEEIKSIDSTIFTSDLIKQEKILVRWFNNKKQAEIKKVLFLFDEHNKIVCESILEIVETLTKPFQNSYNFLREVETKT